MTSTSIRYMREKGQIELALQMIAFEARTHTIRGCTGLSDDRIRKLYTTYFKDEKGVSIRRQRGKSPKRAEIFTRNLDSQRHSATLASLIVQFGLLADEHQMLQSADNRGIAYGVRFCRAYAMYVAISGEPKFCFERAWALCEALRDGTELAIRSCTKCGGIFVRDVLALKKPVCACCQIKLAPAPC